MGWLTFCFSDLLGMQSDTPELGGNCLGSEDLPLLSSLTDAPGVCWLFPETQTTHHFEAFKASESEPIRRSHVSGMELRHQSRTATRLPLIQAWDCHPIKGIRLGKNEVSMKRDISLERTGMAVLWVPPPLWNNIKPWCHMWTQFYDVAKPGFLNLNTNDILVPNNCFLIGPVGDCGMSSGVPFLYCWGHLALALSCDGAKYLWGLPYYKWNCVCVCVCVCVCACALV